MNRNIIILIGLVIAIAIAIVMFSFFRETPDERPQEPLPRAKTLLTEIKQEAIPETAPVKTPIPETKETPLPGMSLDQTLFWLKNKFKSHGAVSGRLENRTYHFKVSYQKDPCVMTLHSKWETIIDGALSVGSASYNLPFKNLTKPIVKIEKKGGAHGVCKIIIGQKGAKRFRSNNKSHRTLKVYLKTETICREVADKIIYASQLCQKQNEADK